MNINDQFLSECVGGSVYSIRDDFAKIILANVITPDLVGEATGNNVDVAPLIAKAVYKIADALMKERVESLGSIKVEVKQESISDFMASMSAKRDNY